MLWGVLKKRHNQTGRTAMRFSYLRAVEKKKKHVLSSRMQVGVAQLLTQQLKEFLEYSDMRINVTPVEMLAIFFF